MIYKIVSQPKGTSADGKKTNVLFTGKEESARLQNHSHNRKQAENIAVNHKPCGDHGKVGQNDDKRQVFLNEGSVLFLCNKRGDDAQKVQNCPLRRGKENILGYKQNLGKNIA